MLRNHGSKAHLRVISNGIPEDYFPQEFPRPGWFGDRFVLMSLGRHAMVPNVFPVLVAGGFMGFAGIPLEFVTMTVAPMIMGLAVDDTIHLVYHLKRDLKKSGDYAAGIRHTFVNVGTAITVTTLILCLTFLVFTVSRVNSIVNMGLITCVGILAAYLADLFVTPVLIRWMKP